MPPVPEDKVKTAPCAMATSGKGFIVTVELAVPEEQ